LYELFYDKNIDNSKLVFHKTKHLINNEEKINKIDDIIFKVSSVAFLLTIQPLPFVDNYTLVILHLYLLKEIALLN
jgi:hypothetical protein